MSYMGSGKIHVIDRNRDVIRDESGSRYLRMAGKSGLWFSGAAEIKLNIDDPPREIIEGDVNTWIRRPGSPLQHRLAAKVEEPSVSIHHLTTKLKAWLIGLSLVSLWCVGLISFVVLVGQRDKKQNVDEMWLWLCGIAALVGLLNAIVVLYLRRGRLLIEFNPREIRVIEDKVTYSASDITRIVVSRWAMYWYLHGEADARLGLRFKLLMKSGEWIELPALCGFLREQKRIGALQAMHAYRIEYNHTLLEKTPLTDWSVGTPKHPTPWKDSEIKAVERE